MQASFRTLDNSPPSPPAAPDGEAALRHSLRRHRTVATSLLLGMAGLTLGSFWLPPGYATSLLQSAAKAGLVGGLADWFAVTALFRHPLGLPIPHTAIIPNQKERLGRGLGRFVANHVFTEAEVRRVLQRLDLAAILRGFLVDSAAARPAAQAMANSLPKVLASLGDGRARRLLVRLLPRLAGGPGTAKVVARALRALVAGGRHQEVFGLVLTQVKVLVASREQNLRDAISRRVRDEGGAVVGWLAGAAVARRVLAALNAELEKIEPGDSELRAAFEEWVNGQIDLLENDPARAAAVGRALREAASHPAVAAWLNDVWARLRLRLEEDAARPDGRTVAVLEGAFRNAGEMLAADDASRARLNRVAENMLLHLLPNAREQLAGFIAGVVQNWDTATVTERIELRVGRDLQYVRMNGTLVGFLVGGALFALLHALFGYVAD